MAAAFWRSPISVILVSSGSRGNKLLFRFPFTRGPEHPAAQAGKPRSRYAVNSTNDNTEDQDGDSRFSDVILATILATKSDMCGKKFELKIDNVRFVGHPTLLQHALGQVSKTDPSPKREMPTMILFNVVFALRANADPSVINCLHNLSRRIAIVLQHEERRCQYLTREAKLILAIQDEVSAMSETAEGPQSPFHHILPKCKLARDLKEAYDRPYHALLLLNDEKSLLNELPLDCSPALVRVIKTTSAVKNLQQLAQDADLALLQVFQLAAHLVYWGKAIIVYPLCENNVYMLSPNASVCLYSPLADEFSCQFPGHDLPSVLSKFSLPVSLSEFKNPLAPPVQEGKPVAGQDRLFTCSVCSLLGYIVEKELEWQQVCISLYTLTLEHKDVWCIGTDPWALLTKIFAQECTGMCTSYSGAPIRTKQLEECIIVLTQLIQMVIWMLQHRLLIQLHTYVCLMVPPNEEDFRAQDEDMPFTARVGGRSLSTPNALSFGSPTSSDDMTLTSPSMDNSSAELIPGGDSPLNKRMTENLLASLSEHEREAILNVPAAQNPEDLRMFARLLHYFRGRHHLEEIMYNENMRRSQLLTLFDKFRSVLVVTNHEDPVISVFQSLLK
ncbi:Nitrogen permease regulator 3-like protein [Chelonia mydas]|uniref:GATOR complex protein NPRL3 n=1 Tax=Chelonia mydas TaxID=8469 RepID=M7APK5_CHEMY|nr:Nitrogen permease regulator 3-like protein [Chelonia mydas]